MTALPDDILDLLTAYALGALEPEELARASALLEAQPELRSILAELRATADALPYGLPEATPPADLRQRVLDRATGRTQSAVPPTPRPRDPISTRVRIWLISLGGIAAAALLAMTIGWAQLFGVRAELARLQNELTQTQAQVASAQQQVSRLQSEIASAKAVLASLKGEGGSGALIQTSSGTTVLATQLPPLQPGRVYQLWRIQGNNAPLPAGLFTVDAQGYGSTALDTSQQPQTGEILAVTNEPDGGSAGPTTKPLLVSSAGA